MESEEEEDKNIARRRKVSLVTKHGGVANVLKIVKAPLINVTLDDWSDKRKLTYDLQYFFIRGLVK